MAARAPSRTPRAPRGWLRLEGVRRNNLRDLDEAFPLGVLTTVTGVSGSGKSSLVSQVLVELVSAALGQAAEAEDEGEELERVAVAPPGGRVVAGLDSLRRLVRVDQRPIGRTPRSNLATYTGLFDHVRRLFAATPASRARRYDAGRFSFNVPKGRCETCRARASSWWSCSSCRASTPPAPPATARATTRRPWRSATAARTSPRSWASPSTTPWPSSRRSRRCGGPSPCCARWAWATCGSGSRRRSCPAERRSASSWPRSCSACVLDEPTTGLHPADAERLLAQLDGLVAAGNTVIVVEHDPRVMAGSDWIIDMGPGAGDEGGRVVAAGTPAAVARAPGSRTAPYLRRLDALARG